MRRGRAGNFGFPEATGEFFADCGLFGSTRISCASIWMCEHRIFYASNGWRESKRGFRAAKVYGKMIQR
jgi:hypothetical protein